MKNKKLRILLDILLILIGVVFLVFGVKDAISYFNQNTVSDAQKFHKSYNYVSTNDSVYEYITLKETNNLENGIILVGEPTDSWTQVLVKPLNDIAKTNDMKVYYLETTDLKNTDKYYTSVLYKLNVTKLTTPTIAIVKNSKVSKLYLKSDLYDKEYDGAPIDYFDKTKLEDFNKDLTEDIILLNK